MTSTGSASTIAIGSGVIGDITTRAERGGFMGIFQAGLLVPVAVGPVIGGALAGSLGWRSIFLFLTIYGAVFLAALIVLLPETLRSVVGNGGGTPASFMAKYPLRAYQKLTKVPWKSDEASHPPPKKQVDLAGPFKILFSKVAAPIIVFLAIYYAVWQMSITALSSLFADRYGLNETQVGLTFIANGVGSMVGTLITGRILDMDYRRVKASHEGKAHHNEAEVGADQAQSQAIDREDFPLERARLRLVPAFATVQCISIIAFGWSVHYAPRVHIAVPIITTFVTGWTAVSTQSIIMTYLVDVYSDRSAAASASLNLARCLFAAGGTSFIMPMINGVGAGLAFTICVIVQGVALCGVVVTWKFGAAWRKEAKDKREARKMVASGPTSESMRDTPHDPELERRWAALPPVDDDSSPPASCAEDNENEPKQSIKKRQKKRQDLMVIALLPGCMPLRRLDDVTHDMRENLRDLLHTPKTVHCKGTGLDTIVTVTDVKNLLKAVFSGGWITGEAHQMCGKDYAKPSIDDVAAQVGLLDKDTADKATSGTKSKKAPSHAAASQKVKKADTKKAKKSRKGPQPVYVGCKEASERGVVTFVYYDEDHKMLPKTVQNCIKLHAWIGSLSKAQGFAMQLHDGFKMHRCRMYNLRAAIYLARNRLTYWANGNDVESRPEGEEKYLFIEYTLMRNLEYSDQAVMDICRELRVPTLWENTQELS
ncbi:hypothetical protein SLS63_007179 [Diaporthe eres]|uniref:Major facilitator superfamily (MFS) profile domain-containing protein n=1 Tax=Diaporthe eres TaxID=83184 RepID=A0ABR1P669_DIAER